MILEYIWSNNYSTMKYKNNLINIFKVVNRVGVRDILEEKRLQHKWTFCGCHANRRTLRLCHRYRTQSLNPIQIH